MPNQPLYISVELDELVERSFQIKVVTDGQPKEGYSSLTAVTKPTEVLLKGASRYIGSVNSVVVKPNIAGAVADVTASLPVSILDKAGKPIYDPTETVSKIEATPNLVDITVPIQRAKEVAINVPTGGKLPSGVFMKEISAVPSKVTIVGPDAIVGGIVSLNTDPIDLSSITGNATRQVKLNIPAGVTVSNNVQNINVNITVETTTTRTFNVPVSYINRPDGLKADLITNTIAVTTSGQASFLDSIAPSSITAVIDLSNVPANDGEYEFTPKLTYPQGLTIKESDMSPSKVKVRITKVQG
jgi:YbbR domain-containing protein